MGGNAGEILKRAKSSHHECEPDTYSKRDDLLAKLDGLRAENARYGAAANMTIEEEEAAAHVRE